MNQADVSRMISALRIGIKPRYRNLKNPEGPYGRLKKLRKTVTALIKYERIELHYNRADEARGYAERLISDAIRNGDCHRSTMEMADFWLEEKQLVHKLFKVLVPRYQDHNTCYTRIYRAPKPCPGSLREISVLELKGNPYPSLIPEMAPNNKLIHNVLLDEARKEYRAQKYTEMALKIEADSKVNKDKTVTSEQTWSTEASVNDNESNVPPSDSSSDDVKKIT